MLLSTAGDAVIRELFSIGPISVSPFGVLLMLAFIGSYLQLRWGLARVGAGDDEDASAIVLAAGIGGVLGAKLYFAILYGDLSLLFERWGLVWYGGFLLGAAAVIWTIRRRRMPPWQTADVAAVTLALGYAIGRVGCFLVGDDYGRPTELPWGVAFPVGLPPTTAGALRDQFGVAVPPGVPDGELLAVHPTQLYETFACLAIWGVGLRLLGRRRAGAVALLVVALLAVERFLVELLRAKDDRLLGPFTLAQAISVAVLLAVAWIAWSRRGAEVDAPAEA